MLPKNISDSNELKGEQITNQGVNVQNKVLGNSLNPNSCVQILIPTYESIEHSFKHSNQFQVKPSHKQVKLKLPSRQIGVSFNQTASIHLSNSKQVNAELQSHRITNILEKSALIEKKLKFKTKLPNSIRCTIILNRQALKISQSVQKNLSITNLNRQVDYVQENYVQNFICEICQEEASKAEEVKLSPCHHSFCSQCMHHYIIYQVQLFHEILCPHDGCHTEIDQGSSLFREFPEVVREKFKKVCNFYKVTKNEDLKLCPNQKCNQGILDKKQADNQKFSITCLMCKSSFCTKCWLNLHIGFECAQNQVAFFQKNLQFRQCFKCKNLIQKTKGCNHIICICGYQFCYLCGEKWAQWHQCYSKKKNEDIGALQNSQKWDRRVIKGILIAVSISIALLPCAILSLLFTVLMHGAAFLVCLLIGVFVQSVLFVARECQKEVQQNQNKADQRSKIILYIIFFIPYTVILGVIQVNKTLQPLIFVTFTKPQLKFYLRCCATSWGYQN